MASIHWYSRTIGTTLRLRVFQFDRIKILLPLFLKNMFLYGENNSAIIRMINVIVFDISVAILDVNILILIGPCFRMKSIDTAFVFVGGKIWNCEFDGKTFRRRVIASALCNCLLVVPVSDYSESKNQIRKSIRDILTNYFDIVDIVDIRSSLDLGCTSFNQ